MTDYDKKLRLIKDVPLFYMKGNEKDCICAKPKGRHKNIVMPIV